MPDYIRIILDGYGGYASYLWTEISNPSWHNYFYWLLAVSIFFMIMEWVRPWRSNQAKFRRDFWLDAFYMFFNFFLFSLVIYNAASDVVVNFISYHVDNLWRIDLQGLNPMSQWPMWAILVTGFIVRDFVQWWTHRLLHRVPKLWEFHKVHHSVEQMGFAAHLRYHWMETIVYRTIEYLPLAFLGIGLYDFFIIHIFSLTIGHYNHSNITVSSRITGGILGGFLGILVAAGAFEIELVPTDWNLLNHFVLIFMFILAGVILFAPIMKILFNSPEMHIWHHAHDLPEEKKYGVNFGLSLAIWDYIFRTAYIPFDGRDIRLGFPGVGRFPDDFKSQVTHGFSFKKNK